MKIMQNKKDGSGILMFTKQEVEMLNKKNYFTLDATTLKHFSNTLVKIAAEINDYFPSEIQNLTSNEGQHLNLTQNDKDVIEE
jgi:hypothetical protein